jgi:RNA polymerase sigma-70 factor, ECF subfamily
MSSRIGRLAAIFPSIADECALAVPHDNPSHDGSLFHLIKLRLRTDEQLMVDLQAGESDSLTILFERHGPLAFRIARRILRNDADAEDVAQQVFLDVFRAAQQFNPGKGTFRSWLLMFAYHRTFNARRRLHAKRVCDLDNIDDALPGEFVRPLYPAPIPESSILVEEGLSLIQPRQRRVIELTYYEGLTAVEISSVTGESIRVVRHNLYRGLEKLRCLLRSDRPQRTNGLGTRTGAKNE